MWIVLSYTSWSLVGLVMLSRSCLYAWNLLYLDGRNRLKLITGKTWVWMIRPNAGNFLSLVLNGAALLHSTAMYNLSIFWTLSSCLRNSESCVQEGLCTNLTCAALAPIPELRGNTLTITHALVFFKWAIAMTSKWWFPWKLLRSDIRSTV